jgi:hypothetical protein
VDYKVRCYAPGTPVREWTYPTRPQAERQRDGIIRTARLEGAAVTITLRPPEGETERTVIPAGHAELNPSPTVAARRAAGAEARQAETDASPVAVPAAAQERTPWGPLILAFLVALIGALPRSRRHNAAGRAIGRSWGSSGGDFDIES